MLFRNKYMLTSSIAKLLITYKYHCTAPKKHSFSFFRTMAQRALRTTYYSLLDSEPGKAAYLSANARTLYSAAKHRYPALRMSDVDKFLKSSYVRSLFAKPHGDRRSLPYALTNTNIALACDLMFQQPNNKVYLTCVDPFSFHQSAVRIPNKEAKTVATGMKKLVAEQREDEWPTIVYTDSGTLSNSSNSRRQLHICLGNEFKREFATLLDKEHVKHRMVKSFQKASPAEKGIARLRNAYARHVAYTGRHNFDQVLPQLLASLNNTPQSRLKLSANEINSDNAGQVFDKKYSSATTKAVPSEPKYSVGQSVRIRIPVKPFSKVIYVLLLLFCMHSFRIADC